MAISLEVEDDHTPSTKRVREESIPIIMVAAAAAAAKRIKKTTTNTIIHLPHELLMEIIQRLPVKIVIKFGGVSKPWYESIHKDPKFASFHYVKYCQKHPRLIFNVRDERDPTILNSFSYLNNDDDLKKDKKKEGIQTDHGVMIDVDFVKRGTNLCCCNDKMELVGYCNGFVCLSEKGFKPGLVQIHNNSRREILCIFPPLIPNDYHKIGFTIGYGFGFDSLTQKYKVVFILITANGLRCLVFTLGTNSWREVSKPPPPDRVSASSKSALFCDGALFWRTVVPGEMLSFDIHDEKFQILQTPVKCDSAGLLHIQEYKGSMSIAHLDQSICNYELHILKDKNKQVWTKETFDLSSPSFSQLPSHKNTTLVGFCDQVLICGFEGGSIRMYNMHTKHLKVVKPPRYKIHKKFINHTAKFMYRLDSHVEENFLSLKTFLPKSTFRTDLVGLQEYMLKQEPITSGGHLHLLSPEQPEYYIFN